MNHLTGAELGKGVLFTPSSNVAFDDNFSDESEGDTAEFYELFKAGGKGKGFEDES